MDTCHQDLFRLSKVLKQYYVLANISPVDFLLFRYNENYPDIKGFYSWFHNELLLEIEKSLDGKEFSLKNLWDLLDIAESSIPLYLKNLVETINHFKNDSSHEIKNENEESRICHRPSEGTLSISSSWSGHEKSGNIGSDHPSPDHIRLTDRHCYSSPPPHLILGMNSKKRYEVDMMTNLIIKYLRLPDFMEISGIIEMGTGYGYLISFLAVRLHLMLTYIEDINNGNDNNLSFTENYLDCSSINESLPIDGERSCSYEFLGLDRNERYLTSASDRHQRIIQCKKYADIRPALKIHFRPLSISYPPSLAYKEALELLSLNEPGKKGLIISLHGCGDLSASMIRLFLEDPRMSLLIQVGCCYHLLSENSPQPHDIQKNELKETEGKLQLQSSICNTFPMSEVLKRENIFLGKYVRNLACSALERDNVSIDVTERLEKILRLHYHSALFHVICISEGLLTYEGKDDTSDRSKLPLLGNLKSISYSTFKEFCDTLCDRLQFAKFPETKISHYERVYQKDFWALSILLTIQRWIGFIVELLILKDRQVFCIEQGCSSELVSLFDPVKSPRSKVLIVSKKERKL